MREWLSGREAKLARFTSCQVETQIENELSMREWLSGRASPCQGEGRGFDLRLSLKKNILKQASE